jgi:hypothetical protein
MDGTPIRIRRSAVPGKRPTINQLLSGELAYNTYDGELTARRDRPGIGTDIIRIGAGTTVTNIIYVTKDGNDTNTGKKLGDAKRTIRAAIESATTGSVIKVSAGTYIENNPIVIPEQVSIVGDSLREVSVSPQNPDQDLFYVANGVYVAEMSYTGTMDPGGAIFAFNPDQIGYFDQSPYVQNGTNFIPGSIGMRIDGSKALGPTKCMVLDSYTQYNQGGIGISITNEGYAQLVSLFTICTDIAVFCGSGGACDLTNSNSSFGTYGLVADGLGPLKYTGIITGSPSSINDDTFSIDLNTPTFNITNALYDNTTGLLTAYTNTEHHFSVGMGITLSGLEFTCPSGPGIVTYPSGNKGYVFDAKTVAPGRYYDSYNLIQSNKQEIQDKSLAAIAINHPDFYFPGDAQTNSRSRYYDSYRLIQQNKQEIVDKSLASIAVGFPSSFNFPDDPVPYNQNRYYDSSGLIQRNKQEIIDKSLAAVAIAYTSYSPFYFPGDTLTNERSRYYDAYRLIQKNKTEIINSAWTNTVASYPAISSTETKCKRDLGFFVDAVSADVFTGGNNYAKQFTLQYFDGVGNPISNGLVGEVTESVFAFNQARDLIKNAITNQLTYKEVGISSGPATYNGVGPIIANTNTAACADVQSNIDTLVTIVTTSIGAGNTSSLPLTNLGSFTAGGTVCARDLGFLVDAISTDVFTGGNKYSREFVFQYYNGTSRTGIGTTELAPSLVAFDAARDYSKKAITNQLNVKNIGISSGPATYGGPGSSIPVLPSGNPDSCTDVQSTINTLVGIVTVGVGIGTSVAAGFPQTNNLGISTINICARDLGYLVDAISTDVFTGGNKYSRDFTNFYFNGATSVGIGTSERIQSVYSFNSLRDYCKKAITNQLNIKDVGISSGPAEYGGVGIAITVYPSGNPDSCTDVQQNINTLVGIVTTVIGSGSQSYLNTFNENLGTFPVGSSKCYRDIGYLIDAVSLDVRDYTNKNIRNFIDQYFDENGDPLINGLIGEVPESITAFNAVRDYSKQAINNQLNIQDLSVAEDPLTGSNTDPLSCANVRTFIDNLVGSVTSDSVGIATSKLNLPSVSMASTVFTCNVGVSTLPHTYVPNTGTAKNNIIRPFDGQVIYFGDLYYTVSKIIVGSGGTGYTEKPTVTIADPDTDWGVTAQAISNISNGTVTSFDIISSGRGYTTVPKVIISSPDVGINTATATAILLQSYYPILSSTPISAGICTVTISENIPYVVTPGTEVPFYKQSRVLASGHSFEYIGSGNNIAYALPATGGVAIQDNEVDIRNGGLVVYTSTDQSGNFRIGEGVVVNQQSGTISGSFYSKSLFSTVTPFILALGG